MIYKINIKNKKISKLIVLLIASTIFTVTHKSWAISRKIYMTVNEDAITNGDISKRINFLNMEKVNGDLNKIATQELIIETLKKQEMQKNGLAFNENAINYLFEKKAKDIGLSINELINKLETQGIGEKHFKEYIAVQIYWNEFINRNFRFNNSAIKQTNPNNLKINNDIKIKEYILKEVTFVIPNKKSDNTDYIKQKIKEAEASRAKFPKDCSKAEEFASKMVDVSVGEGKRILETNLNPKVQDLIKKASNNTTDVYMTQSGVEYIAICNELDIGGEFALNEKINYQEISKKIEKYEEEYIKNIRKNAHIRFYK
ncbi:hypothetical protein [Candidatus Liberibacter americanus]|uniref:Parvulin-like peptidyl-prolyl isomerase n=1 Tax=Candidatus Liberibacter americanus str. Sao Paulo TaxID=1261131 RepID=U6B3M2_9HYPH|nr:hypothetical protein [Candidatus Liberibacter americanus]AHA27669.1 Parvulin-like peptidyl-prolyl isomerase [Candidatus Liberibacter americanus str. Sao Paulo]EMS36378.1 peptidyl-prolyl cis-trans isomerase protein [Candidatus Liberibacter americanus PW_SP]